MEPRMKRRSSRRRNLSGSSPMATASLSVCRGDVKHSTHSGVIDQSGSLKFDMSRGRQGVYRRSTGSFFSRRS